MQAPAASGLPPLTIGQRGQKLDLAERSSDRDQDEQVLFQAFRSFAAAAKSLEQSYAELCAEVSRLRLELTKSNSNLASSLEENRTMRAFLDRVLSSLPCGVMVMSAHGEISRINPEARRLLAVDGAATTAEIHPLPEEIDELLDLARRSAVEQELNLRRERQSLWLAAKHASLDGDTGDSVFILRDITAQKRIEERELRMGRDRALAEMSAILAHEMRNPLGSLELFAGLLADSNLEADAREWVEQVQAGLRTLAATVNNVLHFHSLPSPSRSLLDIGSVLDWARDFLLPLTRRAHLALSVENRLCGVVFSADRHRVEQVLLNLVLNAIRATPEGGRIEIHGALDSQERVPETIRITVSDSGPGIPPEMLPRLFQAGASASGHSGLGLAVCRKIVEQHGGAIAAENRPGEGARFTLTFPTGVAAARAALEPCGQEANR